MTLFVMGALLGGPLAACEDGSPASSEAPSSAAPATQDPRPEAVTGEGTAPSEPEPAASEAQAAASADAGQRYEPPDEDDALGQKVHALARDLGAGLEPVSPLWHGRLPQGRVRELQAVLKHGRCYRIIGAGGDGVEDLDLLLLDDAGVPERQDSAADAHPVLGLTDPICPRRPGLYRIRARMVKGEGPFAVRVFSSS
jgi:hypothetical protein